MNTAEIKERIEAINKEMTEVRATYAKLEGHLGEAHHWLVESLKKESAALDDSQKEADDVPEENLGDQDNVDADNQEQEEAA